MSQRIIKKVLPDYFQDIVDGKKKYELRLNDFEVEPGDVLVSEEMGSCQNYCLLEQFYDIIIKIIIID